MTTHSGTLSEAATVKTCASKPAQGCAEPNGPYLPVVSTSAPTTAEASKSGSNLTENRGAVAGEAVDTAVDAEVVPRMQIDIFDAHNYVKELSDRLGAPRVAAMAIANIEKATLVLNLEDPFDGRDHDTISLADLHAVYLSTVPKWIVQCAVDAQHPTDPVLGSLSELTSTVACIPKRCGDHLSTMLGLAIAGHQDMVVFREVSIPVVSKFVDAFKHARRVPNVRVEGGEWSEPKRGEKIYVCKIDLLVVDTRTGTVGLIESKRGNGATDKAHSETTLAKIEAAKRSVPGWFAWMGIEGVETVCTYVADHYGNSNFPDDIRIVGGQFDRALRLPDLDTTMTKLETELRTATLAGVWPVLLKTVSALATEGFGKTRGKRFSPELVRAVLESLDIANDNLADVDGLGGSGGADERDDTAPTNAS